MASGKGGVERSGVTVIVPTTAGAIQVMGLRWSQRIPSSRVVLGNETSDQCERWTKDYNSLLRPGDPMRTLLGLPEGGGCRLVVSSEIDHGRSWIVPAAAAHFADARAQSVHADMSRARMMIWGTGAIDFSQPEAADQAMIVENDYHLTSKIDLSREHFAAAAHDGTPVLCLLPAGPDAERAAGILRKVLGQQPHHVEIVKTLADVIRPIEAYLAKGNFNAPPDMKYAPVPYTPPPEAEEEQAAAPERASAKPTTQPPPPAAQSPAPPVYGVKSPDPLTSAAAMAATAASARGMSMGLLGGIAAVLIAVIGVGGLMLRSDPTPVPQPPVTPVAQPVPQQVPLVRQALPAGVTITTPGAATILPPPGQGTSVSPATDPVPQPAAAGGTIGLLTILTPPVGSSCQAQVMEMNPRFVETVVELGADKPVIEIGTSSLCGLAIAGSGAAQARFAQGTVAGTVSSLSTAGRIVFNPSNTSGRLPDVAISGGGLEKVELRRK
jgi:hypothetical protein